jgi:hypothetical protein
VLDGKLIETIISTDRVWINQKVKTIYIHEIIRVINAIRFTGEFWINSSNDITTVVVLFIINENSYCLCNRVFGSCKGWESLLDWLRNTKCSFCANIFRRHLEFFRE